MRGLSSQDEAVWSEFVEYMARWVVNSAYHQTLAQAINLALDQYDKNYTEQLNRWRRSQSQELNKDQSMPRKDPPTVVSVSKPQENNNTLLESVTAGLQSVAMSTVNLFKSAASATADMASAALVEGQAKMHPNRANAFRHQYGILEVMPEEVSKLSATRSSSVAVTTLSAPAANEPLPKESEKNELDSCSDFTKHSELDSVGAEPLIASKIPKKDLDKVLDYVIAKPVISLERAQQAFLEGLLGAEGWKTDAHTLGAFGYPSMKTLIIRQVQTAFMACLNDFSITEEKKSQFRRLSELLDPLTISEQAHWTYLSVSSIAKALLSTHDKKEVAVQTGVK